MFHVGIVFEHVHAFGGYVDQRVHFGYINRFIFIVFWDSKLHRIMPGLFEYTYARALSMYIIIQAASSVF